MEIKPEEVVLMLLRERIRKGNKTTYGKNELILYLDEFEKDIKKGDPRWEIK